jgi:GH15 family glucan-1,4-alpha-glucosidase
VRIGNAAADQLQLDLYGEVIDAVAQAFFHGRVPDSAELDLITDLGEFVAANWRRPDQGIWEPRTGPAHNVHSRVLCWVALDRLVRLAERGVMRKNARFEREREAIADEVRTHGYSRELGTYVSTLDGDRLDAALLLLSWYGFEAPASPRMTSTFAAIDHTLRIGSSPLLYRYPGVEDDGGFVACAFWAAEHLARGGGSFDAARTRFETLLGLAAPSGLYGELADPSGVQLGNYPQGFSHLALLNAALSLEERRRRS